MRQCRPLPHLHARPALEPELRMRGRDQLGQFVLRHAVAQRTISSFICLQSDMRRQTHELDFLRALDHAAAGRYRRSAHNLRLRRCLGDTVAEDERSTLLDPDTSSADAAILQSCCYETVRIFVLLPDANIGMVAAGTTANLLARAVFLECRTDVKRVTFNRKHGREESFAIPPMDVGEVHETSPAGHEDRIKVVLAHQSPRALLPLLTLFHTDRLRFTLA